MLTTVTLYSVLSSAAVFGSMISTFAKELKVQTPMTLGKLITEAKQGPHGVSWGVGLLLEQLVKRLFHGVKAELVPLVSIAGVRQARARQLYQAGYTTVAEVAGADPRALPAAVPSLSVAQARALVMVLVSFHSPPPPPL